MPRGLSQEFMDALQHGLLNPILTRVVSDRTLCLEIRRDYINVYYRGGNLLRIRRIRGRYESRFDRKYSNLGNILYSIPELPAVIQDGIDVDKWLSALPELKQAMDLWFGQHPKEEREVQQQIVRNNNFSSVALSTDYYLCDIEYANRNGRFDMVAVRWPSVSAIRRKHDYRGRLVLIEVKYGDSALTENAGLKAHIQGINAFLAGNGTIAALKAEMTTLINQKRKLGLIDCGRDLAGFSDEKPMLMLILVNHDPDSTVLRDVLQALPESPHSDIHIATSTFMGYGLYDPAIYPLEEFKKRFDQQIYKTP